MTFRLFGLLAGASLLLGACYTSRPAFDPSSKPPGQEGTLAGHVTTDSNVPVPGRIVRAMPVGGGAEPYETTTTDTGGYTMKVVPGRYRLELELREGERLVKQPGETNVNPSDLDPGQDFVIGLLAP